MQTIAQLQAQLGHRHGHLALRTGMSTGAAPLIPVSTDAAATVPATNTPAEAPRAAAVDTNSPDVNAAPTVPGATNAAASTAPARSYTVVKGDKIWKIAKRMYPGDTKNGVDKILAANPGLDPKKLKIGQVLVIP
jgi:nucleoid-associated protein YgaU